MLPEYLKKNIGNWAELRRMKLKLRGQKLHTVCESARCPNIGECFSQGVATLMVLGDTCTRSCRFCGIGSSRKMSPVDWDEPRRVARMAKELGLGHVVITSVTRDDLPDGGAKIFSDTIREIRKLDSKMKIEVLTPDFWGNRYSIKLLVDAKPDIFGHNLEIVPRLYPEIRKGADYQRSLDLLAYVKELNENISTKSGIMVGLGETREEIFNVLKELRSVRCEIVFIGHYLQPTRHNIEVKEYIDPATFKMYEEKCYELGFKYVNSGPFVRSSYMAHKHFGNSQA